MAISKCGIQQLSTGLAISAMACELIHIHDTALQRWNHGPGLGGTGLLTGPSFTTTFFDSTTELPLPFMVTPLSATNLTVDVGMDGLCLLTSSLIWSGSSGHLVRHSHF